MDMQEYERQQAILKLLSKLFEAEVAIKTGDEWQSLDDLKCSLGVWPWLCFVTSHNVFYMQ